MGSPAILICFTAVGLSGLLLLRQEARKAPGLALGLLFTGVTLGCCLLWLRFPEYTSIAGWILEAVQCGKP